jgi:diguanylate cyclase (GGDEF)-like protein/PAS domain S-box-containing protein
MASILFGLSALFFAAAAAQVLRLQTVAAERRSFYLTAAAAPALAALMNLLLLPASIARGPDAPGDLAVSLVSLGSAVAAFAVLRKAAPQVIESLTADRRLRRQAAFLRPAFDQLPYPIIYKDPGGAIRYANPAYHEMVAALGGPNSGDQPKPKALPGVQAGQIEGLERQALESGEPASAELALQLEDRTVWMKTVRQPVFDETGQLLGLLGLYEDISDLREARLAEERRRQRDLSLHEMSLAMLSQPDFQALMENMLEWAGRMAGASDACLCLVRPDQLALEICAGLGGMAGLEGQTIRPGQDAPGHVWQTGQALVIADYPAWPGRSSLFKGPSYRTMVGLPLISSSQVLGVLLVASEVPNFIFQPDDIEGLARFAQVTSHAIFSRRQAGETQDELEATRQALEAGRYHARLDRLIATMAAHFIAIPPENMDQAIQHAVQTLGRFAGADRCYVHIFANGRPGLLHEWLSEGAASVRDELLELNQTEMPWWMSKLNRLEPIYAPHLTEHEPETGGIADHLSERGVISFTATPLIAGRAMAGYLVLETVHQEARWSEDILATLKAAAEMLINAYERMKEAREQRRQSEVLAQQLAVLEHTSRESAAITEMSDLLQACRTADEAYPIVARYAQRLVPSSSGALYVIESPEDPAQKTAIWGSDQSIQADHELALNDCWGLRRGRIHLVSDPASDPICSHVGGGWDRPYLCAPLIAHGELVGLLHLRSGDHDPGQMIRFERLAGLLAEQIALALANLTLKDKLRSQAIRDPLTGLFNRRYMEETLERELRRADRHSSTVGVIMFDVDRLKPINDQYGHDAGDVLLKAVGELLVRMFRGEDVACRFGGDEFTVILPEASLADLWSRANQLRDSFKKITLDMDGNPIGPATLSIGIAVFPDHAAGAERLIQLADAAAYQAKSEGGDRVMIARPQEE